MTAEPKGRDDFIDRFREQLRYVDEFVALVLNGHLEIEGHLDDILSLLQSESFEMHRPGFYRKVELVRARAGHLSDSVEWCVMLALNSLRNEVAHRGKSNRFDVSNLRRAVQDITSESLREEMKGANNKEFVVYAAAICCGFLVCLEDDLQQELEGDADN